MTGIFKEPVKNAVYLRTLNLEGDSQADLSVHGGPGKAVYTYSSEHYEFWKSELPGMSLPYGIFGENFTSEGLLEDTVNIGDRFRIGEAEVMITEPRMPCYKLNIRFGRPDMVKRFVVSRRTGFYLAVTREGTLQAGNKIELAHRDEQRVTVADITRLHLFEKDDVSTLQRALRVEALPEAWRQGFREQLARYAIRFE
ncbi:MAG: MOSC domain-containing protein [Chthoniobacterales bacterium]|nr:MOSC domain-containing protein [Chthoniobacterales bacterium]